MKLTVIGCSDAFNSGGRLNTCFHVAAEDRPFLIDCGANVLMGLAREGIDPNGIGLVLISHLHGDHFAGLVWWLIHANHVTRRTAPLTVVGPPGLAGRFEAAAEALFPGATRTPRKFELALVEYAVGKPMDIGAVRLTSFEVNHPSGAPSCALRIEVDGRTLAFSGDTGWVEALVDVARGADLFICECYGFDREQRMHLDWKTLERNLPRFDARSILLTHFGPDMLAHAGEVVADRVRLAEDGLVVDV
jgi:ribonuclease BN (tRNA processing enzyme)